MISTTRCPAIHRLAAWSPSLRTCGLACTCMLTEYAPDEALDKERDEENGPRILTRAARVVRGGKREGEGDPRILVGETRESRGERRVRPERDGDLDRTDDDFESKVGHQPSTRRKGVASLNLDGLLKNAETLQLLSDKPHCSAHFPTPSNQGPNSCNRADVPRHLPTPIAFHHRARFTLPAALATKGERTCVCCICKSAGEFSFILAASHSAVVGTGDRFARPPSQFRI